MVSGFAVLWWVVSACSSASWTPLTQGSYLAFVPTRDWCPTAIGTAPVGQKDGPSTETFKINEKQGKKKSPFKQQSREKGGGKNTALATQLGPKRKPNSLGMSAAASASRSRKEIVCGVHQGNATGISCSNYRCCGILGMIGVWGGHDITQTC